MANEPIARTHGNAKTKAKRNKKSAPNVSDVDRRHTPTSHNAAAAPNGVLGIRGDRSASGKSSGKLSVGGALTRDDIITQFVYFLDSVLKCQ